MDFGDILDDWDRQTAKSAGKKAIRAESKARAQEADLQRTLAAKENPPEGAASQRAALRGTAPNRTAGSLAAVDPLTAWLRVNGVQDKDAAAEADILSAAERRRRLRNKAPDAVIDLHGLTRDEAWLRLSAFFASALRQGAEKVLVVHGKGNHSEGEAVLKKATREFVERCSFAGECGQADSRSGGAGATWVILKRDREEEEGSQRSR
jgi:DNA-nicking Smr family endonuclease